MFKQSISQLLILTAVVVTSVGYAKPAKKAAKKAPAKVEVVQPAKKEVAEPVAAPVEAAPAASTGSTTNAPTSSLSGTSSSEVTVAAPSESKFIGMLDIRPTFYPTKNFLASENTVEIGYQFNKNTKLVYDQYINTVQYGAENVGVKPVLDQADLLLNMANIAGNADTGVSLTYRPQLRLPTDSTNRDAGKIAEVRNYLIVKRNLNPSVALSGAVMPLIHLYQENRNMTTGKANPAFEPRLYVTLDAQLTKELSLSVPIWYGAIFSREVNGVTDPTQHYLNAWPELDYALDANFTIGAAFYLANCKLNNLGPGESFFDGFSKGSGAQIVLQAKL